MIKRSLVGKVWLTVLILVIFVMFFMGVFLSQFFEDFYFSLKFEELVKNGIKISELIADAPERPEWQEEMVMIARFIDARIVITDRQGLIRQCTIQDRGMHLGNKIQHPDAEKILKGEITSHRGTYPGLDMTVLSVGVPIKTDGEVVGAVFLNSPVESVTQTVRTVQKFIFYSALGTLFLATVLGFILSKRLTRPILNMNTVAMAMAKGDFEQKVKIESDDEIGLLGSTLNFLSSELQKNIDALSAEKDQLENILTSMTEAVVTIDIEGNIVLFNPMARDLFKINPLIEQVNIREYINNPGLIDSFYTVLEKKVHLKKEISVGDRIFSAELTPLQQNKGEVRGIVAVLHDITKEKRLELLRREFVANVSHELRSPLSLLQGYVEALADGLAESEEERQRYMDILLDETLRLRRLVNDLLDLTQLETGNMNMRIEKISAEELIQRVTTLMEPLFEEQNKKLSVALPDDLPLVMGDEDKLQQVLVNLLDNAVKYTPVGGVVEVGAGYYDDQVVISVTDSGSGIPEDELEHVWERFYKVDKARSRETVGGTGLGLAIVKNIILAHGGEVKVANEPGKGAKFTFTVKIAEE